MKFEFEMRKLKNRKPPKANHVERCGKEPIDCAGVLVEKGNRVRSTFLYDEKKQFIGVVESVGKRGPNQIEVRYEENGKMVLHSSSAFLWEVIKND